MLVVNKWELQLVAITQTKSMVTKMAGYKVTKYGYKATLKQILQ